MKLVAVSACLVLMTLSLLVGLSEWRSFRRSNYEAADGLIRWGWGVLGAFAVVALYQLSQ